MLRKGAAGNGGGDDDQWGWGRKWGCHLDRRTLAEVQAAGFAKLVGIEVGGADGGHTNYLELTGLNVHTKPDADLMGPTAVGVAFVAG